MTRSHYPLFDLTEDLLGNLDCCHFAREDKPIMAQLALRTWSCNHATRRSGHQAPAPHASPGGKCARGPCQKPSFLCWALSRLKRPSRLQKDSCGQIRVQEAEWRKPVAKRYVRGANAPRIFSLITIHISPSCRGQIRGLCPEPVDSSSSSTWPTAPWPPASRVFRQSSNSG